MADELDFKDLIARASRARVPGSGRPKSVVRRLLEAEFDRLVANPPSWVALARLLNENGHRDAHGQELRGDTLAGLFHRIKTEREGRPPERAGTRFVPVAERLDEPFQIRPINPKDPKETP